ncbi:MAG: SDR family oxidoreductase [Acidimicrobiales bacterium]|jgi:NAD(P)-dependent dehydrogenase (short-subunit alcohol dehydrogenase family)|nr:SDR family oxidoreductase [Acidimicrobiales bacterium]
MGICEGQVIIVTGAGRGLGRAHAIELARQGARVIVNDLGVARDGSTASEGPAQNVVDEIIASGGEAVANNADVADWNQAAAMVRQAIDTWGNLDALVCNAGFLRDRMLASMSEEEWDTVVRVHLKGHFVTARHAITHWRNRVKQGEEVTARVINTSSGAGLMGSIGQGNYAAAKAAIAQLTIQQASEWERYGVLVNAIAPDARTRMTEGIFYSSDDVTEGQFDSKSPENVSPLVAWLASRECDVSGRTFEVTGGQLNVCDGWQHGPVQTVGKRPMRAEEVGLLVHASINAAPVPEKVYGAE